MKKKKFFSEPKQDVTKKSYPAVAFNHLTGKPYPDTPEIYTFKKTK
jgi:hypothetical protein